jgi:poly-gamma-glutamate capsule biosynthesis protein CapA/YwtB (metallophosphatase superfamily)
MRKIFIVLLFVSLVSSLTFLGYETFIKEETKVEEKPIVKEEEPVVNKLSLIAAGDALIHSTVYNRAYTNGTYDFKPMLTHIKNIVKEYDLAFYNQETILGGSELGLSNWPNFNSPYEIGDAMLDAGFNMVSLANNHTLDRGQTAVTNSLAYWKDKTNILTAGSYSSFESRKEPRIFTKNNITYSLLSYTYGTNGIPIPSGKDYLVDLYSRDKAEADITALRDKVDVLIVSMHWGSEYQHYPNTFQTSEAQFLADLDVDFIIGHHPHVIQPIDKIDDTIVIYSLGNFLADQELKYLNRFVGLLASINITKTTYKGETKIEIDNGKNILFYNVRKDGFLLTPFSLLNEDKLTNHDAIFEEYSNIVKHYNKDLIVE